MSKDFPKYLLALIFLGGFVVRLYKINNPIADWHSWRQADTSAVTRNYVKYGINLFFPFRPKFLTQYLIYIMVSNYICFADFCSLYCIIGPVGYCDYIFVKPFSGIGKSFIQYFLHKAGCCHYLRGYGSQLGRFIAFGWRQGEKNGLA